MVHHDRFLPSLDKIMITDFGSSCNKTIKKSKNNLTKSLSSSSGSGKSCISISSSNGDNCMIDSNHQQQQQQQQGKIIVLDLGKKSELNSSLVKKRASSDSSSNGNLFAASQIIANQQQYNSCMASSVDNNSNNNNNNNNCTISGSVVPQNTALRAEARRQNVVRPQVIRSTLVDDWMHLSKSSAITDGLSEQLNQLLVLTPNNCINSDLNNQESLFDNNVHYGSNNGSKMFRIRREQVELDRDLRRQHKSVIFKLMERRKNLENILTIWLTGDIRKSIEKLVDLYNQGLIFATNEKSTLCSLNTSLVVDILNVLILRPKLWTLDICQMLLPILVNDLLIQKDANTYEFHIELGLKCIRLILKHFSGIIISTLDQSQKSDTSFAGVDLSREDRIIKCKDLVRLLLEAKTISARCKSDSRIGLKLMSMYKEVDHNIQQILQSICGVN